MIPFAARLEPAGCLPSRRDWLRLGIPTLAAPLFSTGLQASPTGRSRTLPGFGRAKSVLVIMTGGGQSQFETWDPKPDAPEEVRGEFDSIATKVPGVRLCEHLPKLAALADRYTILRSMTHDDTDHGSACYLAMTGQFHPNKTSNPPVRGTDMPAYGAVLHRVRPTDRFPHSAFHVNGPIIDPRGPLPGQFGGILGRGLDPLEHGDVTQGSILEEGMTLPGNLSARRIDERRSLLSRLESTSRSDSRWPGSSNQIDLAKKAYELLGSPRIQEVFDLDREPSALRDRYGRYRSGQACLMGRRLVEAGVPWVTVYYNHHIRGQDSHVGETDHYGWDTHNDIFTDLKTHLLPRFDLSVSTLLEDMEQRGLLKETLVVIMGEFGRAPLVQVEKTLPGRGAPGRKHWAACYSVVLLGAGITPGATYGASDRHAAYPAALPVTPGDLSATMFHALGIEADTHFKDLSGRPQRIVTGDPVLKLFS